MRTEKEIRDKVNEIEKNYSGDFDFMIPSDIKIIYKVLKGILSLRGGTSSLEH